MDVLAEVKRALKFVEEKKYKDAEKIYLDILKCDKDNPTILSFLGFLYLSVGLYKKADKYFEKSYKIKPSSATIEGLGLTKYYLNDYAKAYKYLSEAVKTTQRFDVYDKYMEVLININHSTKAYQYAKEYYHKFPLRKEALYYLARMSLMEGYLKESQIYSEQLIKKYPKYWASWFVRGLIFEVIYQDDERACECYKKIVKNGNNVVGYYNLAICYSRLGNIKKTHYYIKKYTQLVGQTEDSLYLISSYYFHQRKFKLGYKYYSIKVPKSTPNVISNLKNLWDGKCHKDKTLLVFCDQGLGDHIMFLRFLPQLANKFKKIKVYMPNVLLSIFKRSFKKYKNFEFLPFKKSSPRYDISVVLSDLPYYLKTDIDTIPLSSGYLLADNKKVMEYKEKYYQTKNLKVGVCWEAGRAGIRDAVNRTLNISMLAPMFDIPNVEFYSVQVNPAMDNYKEYPLTDLGSTFKSFDDTAAALKNLDLLITVDTSVLHLAGALGVKTFMFLPYTYDWRWFDGRETTEWYDSVRIFKQTKRMDWSDVVEKMSCEIEKMAKNKINRY